MPRFCLASLAGAIFLSAALPARPADWPQFLGPERNGVAPESPPLLETLPDSGIPARWKRALGAGFAGPVVAGTRCLVFHREKDEACVDALDRETGERFWRAAYPTRYRDSFGFDEGPRSPPTVTQGKVYTYGAEGILQCLDLETGKRRWQVDLAASHGSPQGFFGRACAPLVLDGRVLVASGSEAEDGSTVLAFDADDGRLLWKAGQGEAGYASPVAASANGRRLALFFTREGILALDSASGSVVHQERFRAAMEASVNAASPVVAGDRVLFSASYDTGAGLWEFGPDPGSWRPVWKHRDRLDCHYSTPIHWNGSLFGFHGRQERGQELRCLDWATGEVRWKSERLGAGSLILADGKLLILTEDGELIATPADTTAFNPLWRGQLTAAETRAFPAFSDGFLYARDRRQLVCADLRRSLP